MAQKPFITVYSCRGKLDLMQDNHEDYFGLMEYLELNPLTKPIVYINSE